MKQLSDCKILIVDDSESSIDVLVEALGDYYEVLVAMSGKEALEVVSLYSPDLVLLDIIMPDMDGYETCRQIKSDPETADIPVIFITAMSDAEDEKKGLELGAIDYVTKPISPPIVRARVKNHLELKLAHKKLKEQAKQLEKQNKELIEMERLREDIDQISRHDLKTPLNAVINFPELIKYCGEVNEQQAEYLGYIVTSGYTMLNMINLSLDLLKMEKGVYPFTPASVDILAVIDKILKETENEINTKKLSMFLIFNDTLIKLDRSSSNCNSNNSSYWSNSNHCRLNEEIPDKKDQSFIVQGEILLCYSMLANLIKNAVEASPISGKIEIVLKREADGGINNDKAVIQIHNQGSVPLNIRERFFDKYATSGKKKGTGLGTYSAKLLAETQNGQISMKTSEIEGTTITIYLKTV